jgi:hypothetical protein
MSKSQTSWVGRGKQLLGIRVEGLRDQAFGEDCLLGVCFILARAHHAQFLRVRDVPAWDDPDWTVQAGTLDPHSRYAAISAGRGQSDLLSLYSNSIFRRLKKCGHLNSN